MIKVPTELKQALIKCDYAVFRMYDQASVVECVKKHDNGKEKVVLWEVEFPIRSPTWRSDNVWGICVVDNYEGQPSILKTWAKLLTKGNEPRLQWYRDAGTCDSLKNKGMGIDRLYLEVFNVAKHRVEHHLYTDMFYSDKTYRDIKHERELLNHQRDTLERYRDQHRDESA